MARGLCVVGHDVRVVVPTRFDAAGPLSEKMDGILVHWGDRANKNHRVGVSSRLKARKDVLRVINRLASEGLDWVVLYNLGLEAIPIAMVARAYGVRVAAEYCDLRPRSSAVSLEAHARFLWTSAADRLVPKLVDLNIVISQYLEDLIRSIAPTVEIIKVPALVDTDVFRPDPAGALAFRARWRLADAFVVSYLGSFWFVDGVDVLLRSIRQARDDIAGLKVVLSGAALQGRDCSDVPTLVRDLGLEDDVVLTGWLPVDEVIAAMSAADVLVVPKVDHVLNRAGFPTKVAEYLSIARPVVATAVGDIPTYLQDEVDLLLCEPNDPSALASAVTRIAKDSAMAGSLRSNARLAAQSKFDYRIGARLIESAMIGLRC